MADTPTSRLRSQAATGAVLTNDNGNRMRPSDERKAELTSKALELYDLNNAANAAKKKYDDKRAELLKEFKDAGIASLDIPGTVPLVAEITANVRDVVDTIKLYEVVGHDKFMEVAKVGKGDVEKKIGKDIAVQCCSEVVGDDNISVKVKK